MSDFKVDLGVGPKGRDGWLAVPAPPARDKLQNQVNALEMKVRRRELQSAVIATGSLFEDHVSSLNFHTLYSDPSICNTYAANVGFISIRHQYYLPCDSLCSPQLINKQMAASMSDLEAFSAECARKANALDAKLKARKAKLASFPKKAVQDISQVQRDCISLVDAKAVLEQSRSESKREWSAKLQEARSQLMKAQDAVSDSSEELSLLREDLKYWQMRLKVERVKVTPVQAEVERLRGELDALAAGEGLDGWYSLVVKCAFIQGSNMDLAGLSETTMKYSDIVDMMYARRIPEVLRAHLTPGLSKGMDEVQKACDEAGIWYDDKDFGGSKIGEADFFNLVGRLQ